MLEESKLTNSNNGKPIEATYVKIHIANFWFQTYFATMVGQSIQQLERLLTTCKNLENTVVFSRGEEDLVKTMSDFSKGLVIETNVEQLLLNQLNLCRQIARLRYLAINCVSLHDCL